MTEPEQVFSVRDGEVQYRGHWLPLIYAEPLLANLEGQSWASELADQLSHAITEATRPSIPSCAVDLKEQDHAIPKSHAA